jgi:hypothetical protein
VNRRAERKAYQQAKEQEFRDRRQRALDAEREEMRNARARETKGAGYRLIDSSSGTIFVNNPVLFPNPDEVDWHFFPWEASREALDAALQTDQAIRPLLERSGTLPFAQDLWRYNLIASKGTPPRYYHYSLTLVLLLAQNDDLRYGNYMLLTEKKHRGRCVDAIQFLREHPNEECRVYRVHRGENYSNDVSGAEDLRYYFIWSREVVRYWVHMLNQAFLTDAHALGYTSDRALFGCVPHAVYAAGLGNSVARFMREQLLIPDAQAMNSWLEDCQLMIELRPDTKPGIEDPPWWLLWRPFNTAKPHHSMGLRSDHDLKQVHHLLLVCGNVMFDPYGYGAFGAAVNNTAPIWEWAPFVPPGGERGLASRLTANDLAYIILARIIYLAAKHYPGHYTMRLTRYKERNGRDRVARQVRV